MRAQFQPRILDRAHDLKSSHHAQRAVEAAASGDGIQMGAKQQRWPIARAAGENCGMIAGAVRTEPQPGLLDLPSEPAPCGEMRLAEGRAVHAAIRRGADARQRVESGLHAPGVDVEAVQCIGHR